MKLQLVCIDLENGSKSTVNNVIDATDLRDAIRQSFFGVGSKPEEYEIDNVESGFVESEKMFFADDEAYLYYFYKIQE